MDKMEQALREIEEQIQLVGSLGCGYGSTGARKDLLQMVKEIAAPESLAALSPVGMEAISASIRETLEHHRLHYWQTEDDGPLPLVDLLSPAETITDGLNEIGCIADAIMEEIEPLIRSYGAGQWMPIESHPSRGEFVSSPPVDLAKELEECRRVVRTQIAYHQSTMKALKDLVFAGRITGGTAGRDEHLCEALNAAERQITMLAANDAANMTDRIEQLENVLHDLRNSILCPVSGVSKPEELLPIITEAINAAPPNQEPKA